MTLDRSVDDVLADLRRRYPDTPFLALGQTVWWDEPTKAVLRRTLDVTGLGGEMVLGVHDADYFAKLHMPEGGPSGFRLVPHNDGSTRDLWSAAGEISSLFGAECYPTRHDLTRAGVPLARLAARAAEGPAAFVDELTTAWGWRGLVYTGRRDRMVHSLELHEVGGAVEQMLRFGFEGTLASIEGDSARAAARATSDSLLDEVRRFCAAQPGTVMCHLYQHMLEPLYASLLGEPAAGVRRTCTCELMRFAPDTVDLPRFWLVDLFMREDARRHAREAYNRAVAGSEIYALDKFGLGATPFDIVLPDRGRGTLRVTLRAIHIETKDPLRIPLSRPLESAADLARELQAALGDGVVLVGKAVALVAMLAREFIFVFNEEGSGYVKRTRIMTDWLRASGLDVRVHPILRVRYRTWDALAAVDARLRVPEPMVDAFGCEALEAREFAARWRTVVEEQRVLQADVGAIRRPLALLDRLEALEPGVWLPLREQYEAAREVVLRVAASVAPLADRSADVYSRLGEVRQSIVSAELEKASHFRSVVEWTPDELATRERFATRIGSLLAERRELLRRAADLRAERLRLERGAEAVSARDVMARIEDAANLRRARLVRTAVITRTGLTHADHRPTAWWLPMVDPSGAWFRRIVETTEYYTEPVVTEG